MALAAGGDLGTADAADIPRQSDSNRRENKDCLSGGGKGSARRTVRSAARRSPQRLAARGAAYAWRGSSNG
jgi:hypothetical protein